jgi:hypothetical protein
MITNTLKLIFSIGLISCTSACVPLTPEWDSRFGDSVKKIAALQTINPDAGITPVTESMDGHASRDAIGRYRSSFKEPQNNANSFTIGVGR